MNFLDTCVNGLPRPKQHRPENALFCLNAMWRGAVNILRRTCRRYGNNFFATSRRRTSASAISRFTRLLSCPCGRLSRHLFRFFFLFLLSSKEPSFFWFLGGTRRRLCPAVAGFFCRFHLKNKLRGHIMVQPDGDLVLPGIFDRALQNNFVPINIRPKFVFEAVNDVLWSNRPKCFAGLASFQSDNQSRFAASTPQFLGLIQF